MVMSTSSSFLTTHWQFLIFMLWNPHLLEDVINMSKRRMGFQIIDACHLNMWSLYAGCQLYYHALIAIMEHSTNFMGMSFLRSCFWIAGRKLLHRLSNANIHMHAVYCWRCWITLTRTACSVCRIQYIHMDSLIPAAKGLHRPFDTLTMQISMIARRLGLV